MAEEKKKKRGLLSRLGFKSKAEKLAEEAAEKAAQQKLVDEQMAAKMAAINAAALKSAREQDDAAEGISDAEKAAIEAEEKRQAEIQAAKDVERAKKLAQEKAEKEKAAREKAAAEKEKQEKAEAAKAAKEKAAQEKAAAKKLEQDKQAKLKAEKLAADKAAKDTAKQEDAKKQKEDDTKRAVEAKRLEAEAAEAERVEAKKLEAERLEKERLDAERLEAEKLKTEHLEAERLAEESAKAAQAKDPQIVPPQAEAETADAPDLDAPEPGTPDPMKKGGFFRRITQGLKKSTSRMTQSVSAAFTKRKLDDAALEELEDILISSDLGVGVATKVTTQLAKDKFDKQVTDLEVKIALADVISNILTPLEKPIILTDTKPQILLFVGVNGSGKTTTLGKIAKRYRDEGKSVLIAAGDTFRAAAVEQLTVWGKRAGAPVMSAQTGADAASLVYDAIDRARNENFDILMIDTAGRLQNRTELMDELSKIIRVIKKQDASAPHHSILVLDATVGQNALMQTEAFRDTAEVSGLIMTKLDGTAKGGVLVALSDKFGLPIHHIGIGERIEDLENFSASVFAAAISGVAEAMENE